MSPRFEYRPLALALLALHTAPSLAQESPQPVTAEQAAADAPVSPAPTAAPLPALAEPVTQLEALTVVGRAINSNPNAQEGVPYKAVTSGDERHTRPLAETPQVINVITKAAIEDSGYTDLRAILDAQPGITLGTGENGNAFGDRYIIRGQEARSDVFVDSLRDPGMTIRESFAIEQVEISKGPSSSFAGRGTAGGAVNAITKQASTAADFANISTGFGSDHYTRISVDGNKAVNDELAVRANVLYAYEQVPDRDPADRSRQGVAVAGVYKPTEKLELGLDYYSLRAKDTPDLGSFLYGVVPNRVPIDQLINLPVYLQEEDFLESDVDTYTARVRYTINEAMRVTNLTRQGYADNSYVVTGARATSTGANNPGGVYETATLSTHRGWQDVSYFVNQTNLYLNQALAGMNHEFIFSFEYSDNNAVRGTFDVVNSGQNCITGTGNTLNAWCMSDANLNPVNGLNTLMNRQIARTGWTQDWQVKTTSAAVMDTVDITENTTIFAGIRADQFDFSLDARANPAAAITNYSYKDTLYNGHLGVTYKFTPALMVYASYASASDINGGEADSGTSSGYGGLVILNGDVAGADPEKSQNYELGTKWNAFDESVLLTAALFQITKTSVMEGNGYSATGTFNSGENRVRGIEIGASGEVFDRLAVQAGVTVMDAEVLDSATPANIGKTLSNFADVTGVIQLSYRIVDGLYFGGAVKYESEKYAGQPDSAAAFNAAGQYSQPIPAYTVLDLFAKYQVNKNLSTRLNLGNVTDKDYYLAGYRSGSFLYKGDAANVRMTLDYDF
jgi:catecholate siderophore receptor